MAATIPRTSRLGQIAEIRPEQDFGFLLTKEGGLLYFHRNSLLSGDFDDLKRGDEVYYIEDVGDTGPIAAKVRVKKKADGGIESGGDQPSRLRLPHAPTSGYRVATMNSRGNRSRTARRSAPDRRGRCGAVFGEKPRRMSASSADRNGRSAEPLNHSTIASGPAITWL